MQLKDVSVNLDGVDGMILYAMSVVEPIMREYGPFVCTSAKDGTHSKNSLHYVGFAFDCRTWALTEPTERAHAFEMIKTALGYDYDVVDEGDHFHVESSDKWLATHGDPRKGAA